MRFAGAISAVLFGTAIVIVQVQVASALTPAEVAQQITVRIDGADTGSGVIIERQGNTYTVLTNWHVAAKGGNYTIQTYDGKIYQINRSTIKRIGNVDLAEVQFTSKENYSKADLYLDQLVAGTTVYISGWADPDTVSTTREYILLPQQVTRVVQKPKDEYALVFSNPTKPGMSGGPVLDEQGRLVGIHGQARTDARTGAPDFLGISIRIYLSFASETGVRLQRQAASSPRNTPISPVKPVNANSPSRNWTLVKTLQGHSKRVDSVVLSGDGKTLASVSGDNRIIKIWNVVTGQDIRTLKGHSSWVGSVAFSQDGKTLAISHGDKTIKIWNVATGQEIRTLTGHSETVISVAFSQDAKILAGASSDNTIKIWNVATGQEIRTFKGHTSDQVYSVAFSPDGKTLASGSGDATIKIWNVTTGQEIRTLQGHVSKVYSVAFSPDGKTLASGSYDNTIKIWNIATGQKILTLQGHPFWVRSVAFSPDGKTLASGSGDATIKIWNVTTGQEIRTLKGHISEVRSVAFSRDGKTLASGSGDAAIKIWRLPE